MLEHRHVLLKVSVGNDQPLSEQAVHMQSALRFCLHNMHTIAAVLVDHLLSHAVPQEYTEALLSRTNANTLRRLAGHDEVLVVLASQPDALLRLRRCEH